MKCDLCKRELATDRVLCETCAEAVRRLVLITQEPVQEESGRRQAAARSRAAGA